MDTVFVSTYYVYMNVTLSLDDRLVARARKVAEAMGKTLNQIVRENLEELTSKRSPEDVMAEIRRLSKAGRGRARGVRFNRDEAHARRP